MNKRMTTSEKMEMLKEAGIDVNDMLQFLAEDGIKVTVEIPDEDPILAKIKADGYLHNPMLFRRWIMAQMFHMLKYTKRSRYGHLIELGYNEYLDEMLNWDYQVKFLIDEVTRILKIQRKGDNADEYIRLCTVPIIVEICKQIYEVTKEEYKNAKDQYTIDRVTKLRFAYEDLRYVYSYERLLPLLREFKRRMTKMPYGTKKVPAFKDMYKGIGAYWTCKNLIMFHGVRVPCHDQYESMKILERKTCLYCKPTGGTSWRLFGFMKQLIDDNKFDFDARMREIYHR